MARKPARVTKRPKKRRKARPAWRGHATAGSAIRLSDLDGSVRTATGARALESRAVFDAWQNAVTGFGTTRDKTYFSAFSSFTTLTDQELSNLYHGDAMAARIVDAVPDDMYREGFAVDVGDRDVNEWLAEKLQSLDARGKFADGERWGRGYGGAAILIGANDGRAASTPLIPERANGVGYLYVLDKRQLWPATYYTEPGHPKLGQPETYYVTQASARTTSAAMQAVHETRLIIFRGAPTGNEERELLNSWDYSVLQRPHEVLLQFNTGWKSVELMLTDANQAVFKISGLAEMLGAPDGMAALQARYAALDRARSNVRAMALDAGTKDEPSEEFERQSVSFEQIPATLEKLMLRLAGAVDMPVTRLMGQSPSGLNATGENDTRNWYDKIDAQRNTEASPKVRRLVKIILSTKESPLRKPPEKVEIKWPPLWTETPFQAAGTRKLILEGDSIAVQAGILLPEESALHRFRPEGFDTEISLSDEAVKAREDLLEGELEDMGEEEEPPFAPAPAGGLPPKLQAVAEDIEGDEPPAEQPQA